MAALVAFGAAEGGYGRPTSGGSAGADNPSERSSLPASRRGDQTSWNANHKERDLRNTTLVYVEPILKKPLFTLTEIRNDC